MTIAHQESKVMATLELLRREPDVRTYQPGEVIFNEGDTGDSMYAVVEGRVAIKLRGESVEHVGEGGVFGEMGLIDHQPRSASAVAETASRVAVISEKRFLRLVEQVPMFALQMMRIITDRVRRHDR